VREAYRRASREQTIMRNRKTAAILLIAVPAMAAPLGVFGQEPVTGTVAYDRARGTEGYLARPEGEGPFPGLILIHEWWGLNDNMRRNAEAFARRGYAALAVNLYGGESAATPDEARVLAGAVSGDLESAFANLRAAVSYPQELPPVDRERLASVGWCFDGGWSCQMAKNDLGVRASGMPSPTRAPAPATGKPRSSPVAAPWPFSRSSCAEPGAGTPGGGETPLRQGRGRRPCFPPGPVPVPLFPAALCTNV
jgi:hypothetical protein